MLKEKDFKILPKLRQDARQNLTTMSRATGIPVSTLHDRLKKYKSEDLVERITVLLNFEKLGYDLRAQVFMKVPVDKRDEFQSFLKIKENVNNLFRINNGYDFMAEVLFEDLNHFREFSDELVEYGVESMQEFFVLESVKREGFLTEGEAAVAA